MELELPSRSRESNLFLDQPKLSLVRCSTQPTSTSFYLFILLVYIHRSLVSLVVPHCNLAFRVRTISSLPNTHAFFIGLKGKRMYPREGAIFGDRHCFEMYTLYAASRDSFHYASTVLHVLHHHPPLLACLHVVACIPVLADSFGTFMREILSSCLVIKKVPHYPNVCLCTSRARACQERPLVIMLSIYSNMRGTRLSNVRSSISKLYYSHYITLVGREYG